MQTRSFLLLLALTLALGFLTKGLLVQGAPSPVTAIDILLEPDTTMPEHAAANKERLLKVYPQSFSLDAAHRPHITVLQCFVRTADLDKGPFGRAAKKLKEWELRQ